MERKLYWVSWWSGNYADEGCTEPPFTTWTTGYRYKSVEGEDEEREECSICALISTTDEKKILSTVQKHYPDVTELRFCNEVEPDRAENMEKSGRFPGALSARTDLEVSV